MKNPQIKIIIKGDRHIESNVPAPFRDALNTVGEAVRARRKAAKKQSLLVVNEHFIRFALRFAAVLKHVQPKGCELIFNNDLATRVIIQRFLSSIAAQICTLAPGLSTLPSPRLSSSRCNMLWIK